MKLLGIDYGDSKVGLAMGDTESGQSLPYKILKNKGLKYLLADLVDFVKQESIEKIIIGLPINQQVKRPEQIEKVQNFIRELKRAIEVEVDVQDESFTTGQAQKLNLNSEDDDVAAMLILQGYIDKNF